MANLSELRVEIDGDDSGLIAATNRSEAALNGLGDTANRSSGRIKAAGTQAKAFGGAARSAAGHTGNLAAQFNDIGLMLASGQSPLLLAAQQGTQINQVLGQMGTSGVSRVKALQTAFLSVIQPANLMTFAIIAGGAALVQFGLKALRSARNTRTLEEALEELEDAAGRSARAADILATSVEDLEEEYGDAASRVRELAQAELDLAQARARLALSGHIRDLRELGEEYGVLTREIRRQGITYERSSGALGRIRDDFGLTGDAARSVASAFLELNEAATIDEQAAALEAVSDALTSAGVAIENWPEEIIEASGAALDLQRVITEIEVSANRAADATRRVGTEFREALSDPKTAGGLDALREQLQDFEESLLTEEQLLIESYARRQEMLEKALQERLITQERFDELSRQNAENHAKDMEDIDAARYGKALGAAGSFFHALGGVFQSSSEQLFKIAKVFGAAEALINAWRAYAQVLADPSLPFFAKFAAAASVLSAGLNAVAAIKSVTSSGGGGGSRGGAGAGAATSTGAAAPSLSRIVNIQLIGDTFSKSSIQDLIEQINEAQEGGARLRRVG